MTGEIQTADEIRRSAVTYATVDAAALEAELRSVVQGEVHFDAGSRALYATDGSNYRQVPIGVVIPRHVEDVVQTVLACRRYGAPVLSRGGGTSLAGQCCNVAIVMDMSKHLNKILEIDPQNNWARVQPGVILDALREAAEQHHLTFAPDPATHNHCTLGGMIGNNSCGVHALMGGKTVDNIEALEILTYDGLRLRVGPTSEEELGRIIREGGRRGEIYARLRSLRDRYADLVRARYPNIPRRVSGYNLDQLLPESGFHVARTLVGTESTCVTVLEATARLVYSPPGRSLVVLGYPDVCTACDHLMEILAHQPIGLEGVDDRLVGSMKKKGLHPHNVALLPEGGGWLLVEFGGATKPEADARARALIEELQKQRTAPNMRLFDDPKQAKMVWKVRESALGATSFVPGENEAWEGWEDAAVPPEKLSAYLRDFHKLLGRYGYKGALYGHFGQGCVHTRIDFDLKTKEGIRAFRSFMEEAADLVVGYGGSLSGEHGDGQARAELLPKMFGPELVSAFREFKAIWDPDFKMNPGKVVDPYRMDENLRLGASYNPPQPKTHFSFHEDHGSFANATLRCVGVAECRREKGGTMCPSYMVTREEQHSTRGRAHLLFEMLQGEVIKEGWRDERVKEALDLCLACKGCKGECPVNVDMATYKAEFLSHYYAGRLRPITAYTMGLVRWWSRLAAHMPGVVNFCTQTPVLREISKALAGIAPERQIPIFAPFTFKEWFDQRPARNEGKPWVILWPDTFNNHFHPDVAMAAVEVLEAAGYQVKVPRASLCCGRPLYDYGMLDLAKRWLRQILQALGPSIAEGVPVVGLEPSCVAVFRDELVNLFPHDDAAQRLSRQSFLLSEFLERKVKDYQPPKLQRTAVVHGHCHHKAILRMDAEERILSKLGLDFTVLDSGCCGMAGSFGFEKDHYDVSVQVGERVLLPAVRRAAKDTLIIADGFSCREQIAHATDRRALHMAQVLQMALRQGPTGPAGHYPEATYSLVRQAPFERSRSGVRTAAAIGAGVLVAGGIFWWLRKTKGEGRRAKGQSNVECRMSNEE
jgi:FAD/FMN-containing dehydrogenase/Fe-S oxidoreductase